MGQINFLANHWSLAKLHQARIWNKHFEDTPARKCPNNLIYPIFCSLAEIPKNFLHNQLDSKYI